MSLRAIFTAAFVALAAPAFGQGMNFGAGNSGQPVEILADDGIEWHRETQRYIARGNASARQGDTTVHGDVLTAYYRSQPGGGTEIFRYEAQGKVRITSPTQTAVGDKGVYDIDTGVVVLTGNNLRFTTATDTITARDSLEFWEAKRVAVARGNAIAVSQQRRITGDVLTAHFVEGRAPTPQPQAQARTGNAARPGAPPARQQTVRSQTPASPASTRPNENGHRLQRVEGFGNVLVSTATDIIRAEKGVYNADTGIAMMSERVRITRGQTQMEGDFAEVNLNTGISKLLMRDDAKGGDKRVRGLFVPENQSGASQSRPPERQQGTR
jgi:lipopolysaccharide export system protein LptA